MRCVVLSTDDACCADPTTADPVPVTDRPVLRTKGDEIHVKANGFHVDISSSTTLSLSRDGAAVDSTGDVSISAHGNGTNANMSLTAESELRMDARAVNMHAGSVDIQADAVSVSGDVVVDATSMSLASGSHLDVHAQTQVNMQGATIDMESSGDVTLQTLGGQLNLITATTNLNVDSFYSVCLCVCVVASLMHV